jgi:CysZ protein
MGVLRTGFEFVVKRPRLLVIGAIPPLVTSVVTVVLLVATALHAGDAATWATPFAEGWDPGWREFFRMLFAVILFAAAVIVLVMVFSAITLAIGAPLYDRISEAVEEAYGGVPGRVDDPARVWVPRVIGQTVVTIVQAIGIGIGLFVIGLIPGVGGLVSAVLGAVLGAYMISRELVAGPCDRRGLTLLRDRRELLLREKWFVLGFGVPVYVLLSIPFVSIAVFPAATAGATVLARRILGQRVD